MPRIRTIKPDFFSNEEIGQLSAEARLLFIGLWTLADKQGRLQDRPIRIGAQLFPYDSNWSIASLLEDLDQAKLIWRYEVDDKKCIQIINFAKHQNPHPRETDFGLPPAPQSREITGNSKASRVDTHVLTHGLMDYGHTPPTPSQQSEPVEKTGVRDSKSRFSLKECIKFAKSLKSIKNPDGFGKTIWRSGDQDEAIAAYQSGHSGAPIKKPPDEPLDPVELNRLADELEPTHHDAAQALRASIQAK
jgi:hypothetical protein